MNLGYTIAQPPRVVKVGGTVQSAPLCFSRRKPTRKQKTSPLRALTFSPGLKSGVSCAGY